jgi:uncharacterized protein
MESANRASSQKPSRFNLQTRSHDGSLLVFNSFSGAFYRFEAAFADEVAGALAGRAQELSHALTSLLTSRGFLVATSCNELARAQYLHELPFSQSERLNLTLMPNENCNFRCVYCYEDFKRNRMSREVIDAIVGFVRTEAPRLRTLNIGWFGGEPLSAMDIVTEISERLLQVCTEHEIQYFSKMTTNGYFLTPARAQACLAARITRYQVTLDGPARAHDSLRMLAGGGQTFHKIVGNLRALRDGQSGFHVRIRVNFTAQTAPEIPAFIEFLGAEFGRDPRFSVQFKPVGRWGGPKDSVVQVCDRESGEKHEIEFMTLAQAAGLPMMAWRDTMRLFGSSCYAADPRSFIIGSDGAVYKCTVVFNDPRNQVGRITAEGGLNLRPELHERWLRSGEETDAGCQQCSFRPACQGNLCPLERMNRDEKRCPPAKRLPHIFLPLLAADASERHTITARQHSG